MDIEYVKCDECGREAPVVGMEEEVFAISDPVKDRVFVGIECQECGRRSQPKEQHVES